MRPNIRHRSPPLRTVLTVAENTIDQLRAEIDDLKRKLERERRIREATQQRIRELNRDLLR
jgi:predicted RNase H-like nuclease (RuvC/YqgF family)